MRLCLSIALLFLLIPFRAEAERVESIDEFVATIDRALEAGAPYPGFAEAIDPLNILDSYVGALKNILESNTSGDLLNFTEMFRNQSRPDGATVIGAITHGNDIAMFIAFVLMRHQGEWIVVNLALKSEYGELLKYH